MEGTSSQVASSRGQFCCKTKYSLSKLMSNQCGWKTFPVEQSVVLLLLGLFVSTSTALPHRIPTDVYYSNGNSKLELSLSPEDLLEILQSVTTQDQTDRVQRVMIDHMQQNKRQYDSRPQKRAGAIKMGTGAKVSHLPTTMNGNTIDYEDFPDLVPFLESTASKEDNRIYASPKKRYLGIDIPDYISSGGNPEAIKNMSSKLKALGKRRRK